MARTVKGQSAWVSFAEAMLNILVGCGVALVTQIVVFPWFGIHIPLSDDLWITAIFTVVSLVRSYFLRRMFNKLHEYTDGRL
jgi:hypothetical protein